MSRIFPRNLADDWCGEFVVPAALLISKNKAVIAASSGLSVCWQRIEMLRMR